MLHGDRNAVIYGGGGSIGGAVARALAREGATVHLAGRTRSALEAVAANAGGIDISFNAISHASVHGTPLAEMAVDDFAGEITTMVRTHFITGRAAARHRGSVLEPAGALGAGAGHPLATGLGTDAGRPGRLFGRPAGRHPLDHHRPTTRAEPGVSVQPHPDLLWRAGACGNAQPPGRPGQQRSQELHLAVGDQRPHRGRVLQLQGARRQGARGLHLETAHGLLHQRHPTGRDAELVDAQADQ